MNSKDDKVNMVININDIPPELAAAILDRIQQSIVCILEEFNITGVNCQRKAEESKLK